MLKLFGGNCGVASLSFDSGATYAFRVPSAPILPPLTLLFFLSLNRSSMYGFTKLEALLRKELVFLAGPSEQVRSCAYNYLSKSGLLFYGANSMSTGVKDGFLSPRASMFRLTDCLTSLLLR